VKTRQRRTGVLKHLHHHRIVQSHSTCIRQAPTLSRGPSAVLLLGHDIYDSLGEYFKNAARKWLLSAPLDDSALVPTSYHPLLHRRSAHQSSSELREQPVRRARREEDKGWLLRRHCVLRTAAAAGLELTGQAGRARTNESRRRCASAVPRICVGWERRRVGWPSSLCWPRRARR
jgi:hypothetical protein